MEFSLLAVEDFVDVVPADLIGLAVKRLGDVADEVSYDALKLGDMWLSRQDEVRTDELQGDIALRCYESRMSETVSRRRVDSVLTAQSGVDDSRCVIGQG